MSLLGAALSGAVLLFDPSLPAFAAPKAALLLILAALALPWLPRPAPLALATLAILALTPLIALDPAAAIWGRPPRAEGVLCLAAVLVLALVAQRLSEAEVLRLDRVLHVAGALLALTVLAGVFRLPVPGLPVGFGDGHGGTLGNPNTAGTMLAALLVHASARGGGWRALLPLYAAALFGTGSRAAWLAMLVGLAWLLPPDLLRRIALGLLAAGGLAVFAALSWRAEPAPSAALRLELWGAALRALAPVERESDALGRVRWLIGYGPEQQAEVLERHRRPSQNAWEAGGHERVADRAHSLPLDLWLSFGLAGLAALAWMLRRILRAAASVRAESAATLALLSAGLLGFFGPAEWLLLAIWLARQSPEAAAVPLDPRRPDLRRIAFGLLAGGWLLATTLAGHPAARDAAEREALEARYRALAHAGAQMEDWRALVAAACGRAERRAQDGEAALLCAQIAHQAGAVRLARDAAIRATALRPARPRAWLLRLVTDPDQPQPALSQLRDCVALSRLDPGTADAFAVALRQTASRRPAWSADPDFVALMRLLARPVS